MGYFSDPRRNWAGAFWAATAIPLVLDPWNSIWDESGWGEEQFGAPFAPLGPSGGNYYFTPNFWAGCSSKTVGRRGPRTSPKVSPIIKGTCGAQFSNLILQKNLPWTPPPLTAEEEGGVCNLSSCPWPSGWGLSFWGSLMFTGRTKQTSISLESGHGHDMLTGKIWGSGHGKGGGGRGCSTPKIPKPQKTVHITMEFGFLAEFFEEISFKF